MASGCGDEGQSYGDILEGLREAALSGSLYGAFDRAKGLDAPEKQVIQGFCRTTWSMAVNGETEKLAHHRYVLHRMRHWITYGLADRYSAEVDAAMGELRVIVRPATIDPAVNGRYKKACYD